MAPPPSSPGSMGRRKEANNDPPVQTIQILHLFFQHTLLTCLEILQCCTHSGASWSQAALGSLGQGPDPPGCQSTVLPESWCGQWPPSCRPHPHFRCKVHIWLISIFGGSSVYSPPKDSDCMTNHVLDYHIEKGPGHLHHYPQTTASLD